MQTSSSTTTKSHDGWETCLDDLAGSCLTSTRSSPTLHPTPIPQSVALAGCGSQDHVVNEGPPTHFMGKSECEGSMEVLWRDTGFFNETKDSAVWNLGEVKLKCIPKYYPLEQTSILVEQSLGTILHNISNCFRDLSLVAKYYNDPASAIVHTPEHTELYVGLYQHPRGGVAVEVQKRCGDAWNFSKYSKCILAASQGNFRASDAEKAAVNAFQHLQSTKPAADFLVEGVGTMGEEPNLPSTDPHAGKTWGRLVQVPYMIGGESLAKTHTTLQGINVLDLARNIERCVNFISECPEYSEQNATVCLETYDHVRIDVRLWRSDKEAFVVELYHQGGDENRFDEYADFIKTLASGFNSYSHQAVLDSVVRELQESCVILSTYASTGVTLATTTHREVRGMYKAISAEALPEKKKELHRALLQKKLAVGIDDIYYVKEISKAEFVSIFEKGSNVKFFKRYRKSMLYYREASEEDVLAAFRGRKKRANEGGQSRSVARPRVQKLGKFGLYDDQDLFVNAENMVARWSSNCSARSSVAAYFLRQVGILRENYEVVLATKDPVRKATFLQRAEATLENDWSVMELRLHNLDMAGS